MPSGPRSPVRRFERASGNVVEGHGLVRSDLGRLVTQEARSIRRDLHREVVAVMERRSQQVWIPVTVATLVPGVVFLCIPFIEALRQFTGS